MKRIFFLAMIVCFISCDKVKENPDEITLQGTRFRINNLFCLDETMENYKLTIKKDSLDVYGDFVYFSENGTFSSYYRAWCGNDCFRTVYGKYDMISETELSAMVDSVHYAGWCTESYTDSVWTEYRGEKSIRFTISKENDGMLLILNE